MNNNGNTLTKFLVSLVIGVLFILIVLGLWVLFSPSVEMLVVIVVLLLVVYAIVLSVVIRVLTPRRYKVSDLGEIKRAVNGSEIFAVKKKSVPLSFDDIKSEVSKVSSADVSSDKLISSKGSKVYHRTTCRLAKSILPENAGYSTAELFKKRKLKPCKLCLK
ncbi:hypothetical protein COU61_02355 [Candidatus Pacearchaeota archaeon CG10_big_fil_rev_8_21_14_0_10_35_13]|nr:MAG: hypothetical protein COU61_02355 [Candidatus Pacearchaeota archaeon CG10_big_fil_rev_8_21_14_0_10_35_13]